MMSALLSLAAAAGLGPKPTPPRRRRRRGCAVPSPSPAPRGGWWRHGCPSGRDDRPGKTRRKGSPSLQAIANVSGGSPSSATNTRNPVARKHPARGVFILDNQPTIVFLTVCTKNRQHWLSQHHVHQALCDVWIEAAAWRVGRYILMPDHLHLFCTPQAEDVSLYTWVGYWKRLLSTLHLQGVGGWHRDCWDTRLRSRESYEEKWEYVRHNPVRKGLCARADDWPFQGTLHVLPWD